MLSICIPVFNEVVIELVDELHRQMMVLNVPIEIVLIDDASNKAFPAKNQSIASKVVNIELSENIGRSKIRNLFLQYAQHEYLLFLDCDVSVPDSFLSNYIEWIQEVRGDVVCGGSKSNIQKPERNYNLRWIYSKEVEESDANYRHENLIFITRNFGIKKSILKHFPFDESIKGYGHEDTLMGMNLRKNGIKVDQIDNPVINTVFDSNAIFLQKTKQGIENLVKIQEKYKDQFDFDEIKLLRFQSKIEKMGFSKIFYFINLPFEKLLEKILIAGYGNLFCFNYYKLLVVNKLKK